MSGEDAPGNPFVSLADETRLGVIEAIGDASGDGEYVTLSYSTIRDALGGVDSGKLNYHLRQLRDRFVERTDEGYRLTVPGIRVYQAVSSGRFDDREPTLSSTPIDTRCPECDERLQAAYDDGLLFVDCPDCSTRYHHYPLSPGVVDRTEDDSLAGLVRIGLTREFVDLRSMRRGICPYCSGYVARSVFTGDDADTGTMDPPLPTLSCPLCSWTVRPPIERLAAIHHATATFYEERGYPAPATRVHSPGEWAVAVPSTDPLRVEVSVTLDNADPDAPEHRAGDTLRHVVDGDLNVVEWAVLR